MGEGAKKKERMSDRERAREKMVQGKEDRMGTLFTVLTKNCIVIDYFLGGTACWCLSYPPYKFNSILHMMVVGSEKFSAACIFMFLSIMPCAMGWLADTL